ncbi:hypothetical protein ACM41_05620 [Bradyrhizobium sp. CCBAU 21362]|nr:hypothetical protein [Bradyrhizobium sp. CCBAU 21362]
MGGGVIGGGWAARFVLNGVDVRLYDPAPGALDRVQQQLANARRAFRQLTLVPLPPEGALTMSESIADAVDGVEIVLESAPERLDLKQPLLAAASQAAAPGVLICSSTSGLRPSLLAAGVKHPERLLVAHPFNPVYLLPLVELCGSPSATPGALKRAAEIFQSVGMHPLVMRKEVDGFIANRLQEAMWREALWLVHDDLATVDQVDDAIRYSFGLRRAVIGPYSLGGGGAGMRQNMEKWGPVQLKQPWSRLTDVPELTEAFVNKLVEQSEVRAGNLPVPEFEQKRDDCMVALLKGLRAQGYGAGETVARWEQELRDRVPPLANSSGPLRMPTLQMPSDWVDYNGHITENRYLQLCGMATDNLLRHIGIDGEYRAKYGSYYTVETHISHLQELFAGDRVQVLTQIVHADDKRLHLFHVLRREGDEKPAATGEQMLIHVNGSSGTSAPVHGNVRERLLDLAGVHAKLPRPDRVGASIGVRKGA